MFIVKRALTHCGLFGEIVASAFLGKHGPAWTRLMDGALQQVDSGRRWLLNGGPVYAYSFGVELRSGKNKRMITMSAERTGGKKNYKNK